MYCCCCLSFVNVKFTSEGVVLANLKVSQKFNKSKYMLSKYVWVKYSAICLELKSGLESEEVEQKVVVAFEENG